MTAKPFNWLTFLQAAMQNEPSAEQGRLAWAASLNWPTCACGELCRDLPRNRLGEPLDTKLRELGCEFMFHVSACEWGNALTAFREIEARTALLSKMAEATP